MMTGAREFWVWKSAKAMYAHEAPRNMPGEFHVIEYDAYDKLLQEVKRLRAERLANEKQQPNLGGGGSSASTADQGYF